MKYLWGFIIIVLIAAVASVVFYVKVPKPNTSGEPTEEVTLWEAMTEPEPSPYSLKFESPMACVVDQQGNGIADATVTFHKYIGRDCNGNPVGEPPAWQGTKVITNEQGGFSIPPEIWSNPEDENQYRILVDIEAQGFLPRKGIGIGTNYADDSGRIDLLKTGRIEGALIDPNGNPIANAPVRLDSGTQYKNPNESCRGCFSATVKTDEVGSFVFEEVPSGYHFVKFPGPAGCRPDESTVIPFKDYPTFQFIKMGDGEIKTDLFLDLRQNGAAVKGKVVDHQNRPMAGVNAILIKKIIQYDEDGSGWSSFTENLQTVNTDENGDYVINRIPPGDYQIQAQYPYEKGKNYTAGDALDIYLAGQQTVSFDLVLQRQDGSKPKYAGNNQSLFPIPLPDDLGPYDVMIVDPQGHPIAHARVEFTGPIEVTDSGTDHKSPQEWQGAELVTDDHGVFELPEALRFAEGKRFNCRMQIKADGFQTRNTTLYSFNLKDPRIDILPVGSIQGRIIGHDGEPPVNARVELQDQMTAYSNPGSSIHGGGGAISPTMKDGQFRIDNLPQGVHILRYVAQDNNQSNPYEGKMVVFTEGGSDIRELVIDVRQDVCTVVGRVLDRDGKPVKKAQVRLCKKITSGTRHNGTTTSWPVFYQSEQTNRSGEYEMVRIHPGIYEIEATLEGNPRRTSEKKMISVSGDQPIKLDLRLNR